VTPAEPTPQAVRIDIVVFDGVDEMDALGPLEVLRSASSWSAALKTHLVTREPQDVVRGLHGLRFLPDGVLVPGAAQVLLVPGGGWATRADVGAWGEAERGTLLPVLAAAAATAEISAGVCTGTMLLARAGVVGSRRASTHASALADLAAAGATVVADRVVDDGSLVTSGGVTSGFDLALWLVERLVGREAADGVAARMEYARYRPSTGAAEPPA
jgi:transcriptional regulator GlxA family with amidase domain